MRQNFRNFLIERNLLSHIIGKNFVTATFLLKKLSPKTLVFTNYSFSESEFLVFPHCFTLFLFFSGIHSCDNNQIYAKCHQHFHCQPGNGRHVGNVILCPSFSHLGCDKYMDFWISYVSNCHLHSSKSILMGKKV